MNYKKCDPITYNLLYYCMDVQVLQKKKGINIPKDSLGDVFFFPFSMLLRKKDFSEREKIGIFLMLECVIFSNNCLLYDVDQETHPVHWESYYNKKATPHYDIINKFSTYRDNTDLSDWESIAQVLKYSINLSKWKDLKIMISEEINVFEYYNIGNANSNKEMIMSEIIKKNIHGGNNGINDLEKLQEKIDFNLFYNVFKNRVDDDIKELYCYVDYIFCRECYPYYPITDATYYTSFKIHATRSVKAESILGEINEKKIEGLNAIENKRKNRESVEEINKKLELYDVIKKIITYYPLSMDDISPILFLEKLVINSKLGYYDISVTLCFTSILKYFFYTKKYLTYEIKDKKILLSIPFSCEAKEVDQKYAIMVIEKILANFSDYCQNEDKIHFNRYFPKAYPPLVKKSLFNTDLETICINMCEYFSCKTDRTLLCFPLFRFIDPKELEKIRKGKKLFDVKKHQLNLKSTQIIKENTFSVFIPVEFFWGIGNNTELLKYYGGYEPFYRETEINVVWDKSMEPLYIKEQTYWSIMNSFLDKIPHYFHNVHLVLLYFSYPHMTVTKCVPTALYEALFFLLSEFNLDSPLLLDNIILKLKGISDSLESLIANDYINLYKIWKYTVFIILDSLRLGVVKTFNKQSTTLPYVHDITPKNFLDVFQKKKIERKNKK